MQDGSGRPRPPWVIAVAAVSGGGKTTVANGLGCRLPQATVVSFDDYDVTGPRDIVEWVGRGADYRAWDLTPLVRDLQTLLAEPWRYIILDYPFGYAQPQLGPYVDLAIFVDTPLDVAFCRRIIRDHLGTSLDALLRDVKQYMTRGRQGYLEALRTVRTHSDIIVDGTWAPEQIVADIADALGHRFRFGT